MALHLSSWLRSCEQLYVEQVTEAIRDAREAHARRTMPIEEALRTDCSSAARNHPDDHADDLAWAQKTVADLRAGLLPNDPHHDDAPSGYTYKGIPATWGDLRAAYADDLPDGWQ